MRLLDLVRYSSVAQWYEVAQPLLIVDYVGEVSTKKLCKYSEYRSF